MQVLKSVGTGIHLCIIHRVLGSPIGTLTQFLVFFFFMLQKFLIKFIIMSIMSIFFQNKKYCKNIQTAKIIYITFGHLSLLWLPDDCKISREAHCAVNKAVYVVSIKKNILLIIRKPINFLHSNYKFGSLSSKALPSTLHSN